MTNDHESAWVEILRADSTYDDLEVAIADQVAIALEDLQVQLQQMPHVTDRERQQMAKAAEPVIVSQTRAALTAGWRRLQAEASGTVH